MTPIDVYIKRDGKYCGCDPTPVTGQTGDAQFPVYDDRPVGGAWEVATLSQHDGGKFGLLFRAANRELTINDQGGLETRVAGTFGEWESEDAATQPDGSSILWRGPFDGSVRSEMVLALEVA
jgi:hypothetical protein